METSTTDTQSQRTTAYGKDEAFDLEVGMAVFGPDGVKIGQVTEVAGFGATRQGAAPSHGDDERLTEAQSGTGFLKVSREGSLGEGASILTIPFHRIQEIRAGHGVILKTAVITGGAAAKAESVKATETPATGWRKWLPGKKS